MTTDMFERKQAWRRRAQGAARTSQTTGYLIAGAILGIALVAGLGYLIGHAPVGGLEAKNTALTMQAARAKAQRLHDVAILRVYIQWMKQSGQRHCVSYEGDIRNIQRLMGRGDFGAAAALAELDLGNPDSPACDASGLAMIYFSASLDDLESSPPSAGADESLALRFEHLNAKADSLGLDSTERESPLITAASAYRNQLWSLSRAAFQLAWKQQLVGVGPVDKEPLGAYYAATVNQAKALLASGRADVVPYARGLLKAAQEISDLASLGRGEARDLLIVQVGRLRAAGLKPVYDPVLTSLQRQPR